MLRFMWIPPQSFAFRRESMSPTDAEGNLKPPEEIFSLALGTWTTCAC
jgi:hypothetical protein